MSKYVFLLGRGIGYSLSPRLQGAAAAALNLPWEYKLLDVEPGDFAGALQRIVQPDCLGANVTVPYKEQAARQCQHLDETAASLGAVNTLVNRAGTLWGCNTDPAGLKADLDRLGIPLDQRSVAILGAGGAAAAVLSLFPQAKPVVVCRHREQGEALSKRLGIFLRVLPWQPLPPQDLVFNCTPSLSRWQALVPEAETVYDLNYQEQYTLPNWHNGLGMLLFQGALAFQLWTGLPAPLEIMTETLNFAKPL